MWTVIISHQISVWVGSDNLVNLVSYELRKEKNTHYWSESEHRDQSWCQGNDLVIQKTYFDAQSVRFISLLYLLLWCYMYMSQT